MFAPSVDCIAGVVTVGYASVAGDTDSSSKDAAANASAVLFGVTLTLLGQVVQAAQVGAEGQDGEGNNGGFDTFKVYI